MKGVVISRENSKMATGKWITSAVVAIGPKTEADATELYEKLCVGQTVSISLTRLCFNFIIKILIIQSLFDMKIFES